MSQDMNAAQQLMKKLRNMAVGCIQTGRWIDQITYGSPSGTPDGEPESEDKVPAGYHDTLKSGPSDVDLLDGEEEPEVPPDFDEYSDFRLLRDSEGKLYWSRPAEWEPYTLEEQTDQLESCADLMKEAAAALEAADSERAAMKRALEAAYKVIDAMHASDEVCGALNKAGLAGYAAAAHTLARDCIATAEGR